MKWRKIVKFGFIKETPKSSFDENTFKVIIVREVDDKFENLVLAQHVNGRTFSTIYQWTS